MTACASPTQDTSPNAHHQLGQPHPSPWCGGWAQPWCQPVWNRAAGPMRLSATVMHDQGLGHYSCELQGPWMETIWALLIARNSQHKLSAMPGSAHKVTLLGQGLMGQTQGSSHSSSPGKVFTKEGCSEQEVALAPSSIHRSHFGPHTCLGSSSGLSTKGNQGMWGTASLQPTCFQGHISAQPCLPRPGHKTAPHAAMERGGFQAGLGQCGHHPHSVLVKEAWTGSHPGYTKLPKGARGPFHLVLWSYN